MHSAQAYFTEYMKVGVPNVQSNWETLQLKHPLKGLQQLPQFRRQQLNHFASHNVHLPYFNIIKFFIRRHSESPTSNNAKTISSDSDDAKVTGSKKQRFFKLLLF